MRKELALEDYIAGIKNKDRTILARAITLIESQNNDHQKISRELVKTLLPLTGTSRRIGISGTPGVGKSTFIEAFGKELTNKGKSVAVLAVDPTSKTSGGSILGDKTRMNELAIDPLAFIRPSPSGEELGGVASRTRESILLCEAFGFDYVLVETVGVGQSETTVSEMVDYFIMLLQPGAGDDLQGIKRGILEVVDLVMVTKDDGDNQKIIEKAKHDYEHALHILRSSPPIPKVLSTSAITKKGFPDFINCLDRFFVDNQKLINEKRKRQGIDWMWKLTQDGLLNHFKNFLDHKKLEKMEIDVLSGKETPLSGSHKLLESYLKSFQKD